MLEGHLFTPLDHRGSDDLIQGFDIFTFTVGVNFVLPGGSLWAPRSPCRRQARVSTARRQSSHSTIAFSEISDSRTQKPRWEGEAPAKPRTQKTSEIHAAAATTAQPEPRPLVCAPRGI